MRHYLLPLSLLLASPALAESETCSLYDPPEPCVRVLACVGGDGLWFDGRAYGAREGRIEGQMSDGTICGGSWTVRNFMGIGRSDLNCDDGREARVYYTYRDRRTGTATGSGRSNFGESIKVWAGEEVLAYLAADGAPPLLPCRGGDVPLN
jgi:hypothetical protein